MKLFTLILRMLGMIDPVMGAVMHELSGVAYAGIFGASRIVQA